ncbi:hypothetical protein AQS8620_03056 [Aquimixticola soesokkakensis]|uniref:Holin of 3TMs, for gene-transfer release n=1 Tax=Aquimixticola soesokkakensis TaxID=1519096 RepID=A0A1Y5TJQ3_9RHOB|nr:holin family protein [Aquimixticola soesokkakensis]SLN65859.1 hypothetical protein AQS8620_03056 [Aquimixticola soesokkakensis]
MGVIGTVLGGVFGNGSVLARNVVKDTAEVFMENREQAAVREAATRDAALAQFGQEFAVARMGRFDRFMDGLNRLPRPLLAFGTLGLFVSAMVNPIWFASRMQGIVLVPEPMWWLMGAIVSFYFGARYQAKGQEFQQSVSATMARAATVTGNIAALRALDAGAGGTPVALPAPPVAPTTTSGANRALEEWRTTRVP